MRLNRIISISIFALITLWLTACTYEIEINIGKSASGNPVFSLASSAPRKFEELRINSLTVIKRGNRPEEDVVVWQVYSLPPGFHVKSVEYGVVPDGFSVRTPAESLVSGKKYRITVSANGHVGQQDFVFAEHE